LVNGRANSHALALGAAVVILAALSLSSDSVRPVDSTTSTVDVQRLPSPQHAGGPSAPEPAGSYPTAAPEVCGYWTVTYADIARRYGEIGNCTPADVERSAWVITTLGTESARGVVAVYRCVSAACRDGRNDHSIAGWRIYPAPYAGGVTLLGQQATDVLIVDNGGHEIVFDVATGRYGV
jgi:hypothetical protein